MADAFGANIPAVSSMARDLGDIRAELSGIAASVGNAGAATGSAKVSSALENFVSKSSDNRKKLDKMLEGAESMLTSLVEGAHSVDSSLVQSLTPAGDGGGAR